MSALLNDKDKVAKIMDDFEEEGGADAVGAENDVKKEEESGVTDAGEEASAVPAAAEDEPKAEVVHTL